VTIADVLLAAQDESPRFQRFLAWVLPWEATVTHAGEIEFENDHDGAGLCFAGLEQRDDGLNPSTLTPHWLISKYASNYWLPWGEKLPDPTCYVWANFAVNAGVHEATLFLQRSLGVDDDGVMGDITLSHSYKVDPVQLGRDICDQAVSYYRHIAVGPSADNLTGWLNRTADCESKFCG